MTTSKTYRKLDQVPYRKLDRNGSPISGIEGELYADDVVPMGYQLVAAEVASQIEVGDYINVGTSYEFALLSDPRPGRSIEQTTTTGETLNEGLKSVCRDWRAVTHIDPPREMAQDEGYYDDIHSSVMSGFICTGQKRVMVCRVYFR